MLSFFVSVIATPFGLDGHAATMAAARRMVRKNSVTRSKARGSIRDAIRRGSDWHGLHMIPRGDGANWPCGSRDTRAADGEHPDPAVVRKYCAQLRQGTANTRDAAPRAPICYALSRS
jgi:hypothetical protein